MYHSSSYHTFPRDYIGNLHQDLYTSMNKIDFIIMKLYTWTPDTRGLQHYPMSFSDLSTLVVTTLPRTILTCLNKGCHKLQQVSHPQELHSQINITIPMWRSLSTSSNILYLQRLRSLWQMTKLRAFASDKLWCLTMLFSK